MSFDKFATLLKKIESEPRIRAEEARLKALGVSPITILMTLVATIFTAIEHGGDTGEVLIQTILTLLRFLTPPTPAPTPPPAIA